VRHLDGNPKNNSADNLAWGTYAENENDKRAHGTYDMRRTGKLSTEDRNIIRQRAVAGVKQAQIAREFAISRPTVTRLINGATWRSAGCAL